MQWTFNLEHGGGWSQSNGVCGKPSAEEGWLWTNYSGRITDGIRNDCKLTSAHLWTASKKQLLPLDWSLQRRARRRCKRCRIWHFKEDDTFEHSIAALLETMGERGGASLQQTPCDKITLGDMVLIPGDGKPRGFWKLESLITGNDGQTRGAVVRVASADRLLATRDSRQDWFWKRLIDDNVSDQSTVNQVPRSRSSCRECKNSNSNWTMIIYRPD